LFDYSNLDLFCILTILTFAAWFGIVAGMVECAGLLLFQRINRAN
jgi:hypothetical protein